MDKSILFVLKDSKIEKKANERVTEPAKAYRHTLQIFSFLPGSGANTESVTEVNSCSIFSLQLQKVDGDLYTKIKSLTFIPFSVYTPQKMKSSSKMSVSTNNSKVILNSFIFIIVSLNFKGATKSGYIQKKICVMLCYILTFCNEVTLNFVGGIRTV